MGVEGDVMRVEGDVMGVEGDVTGVADKVLARIASPRTGILLPPSAQ